MFDNKKATNLTQNL